MARHSAGATASGAGTSAQPIGSIFSAAGSSFVLREFGIFNTTDTTLAVRLVRLTAQGTPGTGLTEAEHDPNLSPPLCTAFNTHSANATVGDDLGYRAQLGAAKGSGIVWTFGADGIRGVTGTANGVGIVPIGTGQVCEFYLVWDE
jgi:hypothetical protein